MAGIPIEHIQGRSTTSTAVDGRDLVVQGVIDLESVNIRASTSRIRALPAGRRGRAVLSEIRADFLAERFMARWGCRSGRDAQV